MRAGESLLDTAVGRSSRGEGLELGDLGLVGQEATLVDEGAAEGEGP